MEDPGGKNIDRRIVRTRQLLQHALSKLLETRQFEELSVQDITDAATVNRATFYAHYPDKFALLECLVAGRFHGMVAERGIKFEGPCPNALKAIIASVCDFLEEISASGNECPRRIEPQVESAIIAVVRGMILQGLTAHGSPGTASPEILASTVSGAIYGAAKEWLKTPARIPSQEVAGTVQSLVHAILLPQTDRALHDYEIKS